MEAFAGTQRTPKDVAPKVVALDLAAGAGAGAIAGAGAMAGVAEGRFWRLAWCVRLTEFEAFSFAALFLG